MSRDITGDHEVSYFDYEKIIKRVEIPVISVFFNTEDYPGKFVARLFDRGAHTPLITTADTLEELREKIPSNMVKMDRHPKDDPCIVEVWI